MRIFILGGGFGGLQTATILRQELSAEHDITVVDRNPKFTMGLNKPWIMVGKRTRLEVEHDLARLNPHRIQYIDWDVQKIDLKKRTLLLSTQETRFDFLVIATGAALVPETIPGFSKGAINVYTPTGAEHFYQQLQDHKEGPVVILVTRLPIKCPPAPYEMAMLVKEYLTANGKPDIPVEVYTPEPIPLPVAGPENGKMLFELASSRGVKIFTGHPVKEIDPATKTIVFENGARKPYGLLGGIPPHVASRVLQDTGLLGEAGWIDVDKKTLKTSVDGVYAIGDVTSIKLANGMALPKAGVFAEKQGEVVARQIAAKINGKTSPLTFDGRGECYMETGLTQAAKVSGDFFAEPVPKVEIGKPSETFSKEKEKFERERVERWLK